LRFGKLIGVAKLRLSSVRAPRFPQVHYSVVRLRGTGTFDPADPQVLEVSSPCKSTVMLDISSKTCM